MFLFLDDLRTPPPEAILCRTAEEAIALVEQGKVTRISFDHDLGEGLSGYDVAKRIEELVATGQIPMPRWQIHSANPVGRRNIEAAMHAADRLKPTTRQCPLGGRCTCSPLQACEAR